MGGFAVVVDWDRPIEPGATDAMMELIPHRSSGGTRSHASQCAVLAEGRMAFDVGTRPWSIASVGPLSIVGDIRLWSSGRLRAAAGGEAAAAGLDDRHLLLEAYRRRGLDFLDAVDGDFAFVIWDNDERRVLAVRDRFAAKPLFFERTRTGVRFASEAKQLAATSIEGPNPDPIAVRDFVEFDFGLVHNTFFAGVSRVAAAQTVVANSQRFERSRYWHPAPSQRDAAAGNLPDQFREHLVRAVSNRLGTSTRAVAQLSGGLDSSSVSAAAAILAGRGHAAQVTTASAVFDLPSIDESQWIDDTVARLPFPHRRFTPHIGEVRLFDHDMWLADGPLINPIRDIIHETAAIADAAGAHLVLTGDGGDYVLDQDHYLADILRIGRVRSFLSDLRASAAWRGVPIGSVASAPMRQLTPQPARVVARRLRSLKRAPRASLVRPCEVPDSPPDRWSPSRLGFPSETQEVLAADIHHPIVAWMNEAQGNLFAGHGIDLTHPFFDRGVVEFVLGIHPGDLPFDGRSKTLVRQAFASDLPASVLDRRRKTIFDEYFDQALRPHHLEYRARYPSVGPNAAAIIDDTAYRRALRTFDEGQTTGRSFRTLQRAWYVMAWLDSLGAYQRPRR